MSHVGIGRRIAQARAERGLTQRELAERVGVAPLRISFWECGRKGISLERLKAVARHLHVSVHWLVTGQGES